ncbi:uncharacterized protein B0H18DRAFT_959975 [Fomitopsis serialis]|uniref:uncharacterized protein n=1 Tax=Fomitopsis serialis TaxID=139415 RepID=UPI0020078B2F|nr:uncharacterized protein B0H18DRAFT_959975 [Neoantrodia serialis]KAH9914237.1 hypothetical protein B0H18DRAFT_959975 [Neoantrodia serialis]
MAAQDTPLPSIRTVDSPSEILDESRALHGWRSMAFRDSESIYEEERARMKHSWRLQHSNADHDDAGIGAQSLVDASPDNRTSLSRTVTLGGSAIPAAHGFGPILWCSAACVLKLAAGSIRTLTPANFLAALRVAMSALQFFADILMICIGIAPCIFILASDSLSYVYSAVAPYLRICGIMSVYLLIQGLIALLTCLDTAAVLGQRLVLRPTLHAMRYSQAEWSRGPNKDSWGRVCLVVRARLCIGNAYPRGMPTIPGASSAQDFALLLKWAQTGAKLFRKQVVVPLRISSAVPLQLEESFAVMSATDVVPLASAIQKVAESRKAILEAGVAYTLELRRSLVLNGISYHRLEDVTFPMRRLQKQNKAYREEVLKRIQHQAQKARRLQSTARVLRSIKMVHSLKSTLQATYTETATLLEQAHRVVAAEEKLTVLTMMVSSRTGFETLWQKGGTLDEVASELQQRLAILEATELSPLKETPCFGNTEVQGNAIIIDLQGIEAFRGADLRDALEIQSTAQRRWESSGLSTVTRADFDGVMQQLEELNMTVHDRGHTQRKLQESLWELMKKAETVPKLKDGIAVDRLLKTNANVAEFVERAEKYQQLSEQGRTTLGWAAVYARVSDDLQPVMLHATALNAHGVHHPAAAAPPSQPRRRSPSEARPERRDPPAGGSKHGGLAREDVRQVDIGDARRLSVKRWQDVAFMRSPVQGVDHLVSRPRLWTGQSQLRGNRSKVGESRSRWSGTVGGAMPGCEEEKTPYHVLAAPNALAKATLRAKISELQPTPRPPIRRPRLAPVVRFGFDHALMTGRQVTASAARISRSMVWGDWPRVMVDKSTALGASKEPKDAHPELMQAETRLTESVVWTTHSTYYRCAGGLVWAPVFLSLVALMQGTQESLTSISTVRAHREEARFSKTISPSKVDIVLLYRLSNACSLGMRSSSSVGSELWSVKDGLVKRVGRSVSTPHDGHGGTVPSSKGHKDSEGTRTDAQLISAIQRTWLLPQDGAHDAVAEAKFSLDSLVGDEGSNYSAGEKRMLVLYRALAKNSRIIVLVWDV